MYHVEDTLLCCLTSLFSSVLLVTDCGHSSHLNMFVISIVVNINMMVNKVDENALVSVSIS